MSTKLDQAIFYGLMIVVVFAALAHGVTEPWSVVLFGLMIGLLALVWVVRMIIEKSLVITIPTIALPLFGLLVFGIAQSLALTDQTGRRLSLSMNVESTRETVMLLAILFVALMISANFLLGRERLRTLAKFMVIYGFVMALFALVQYFAWNGQVYWLRPAPVTAFGPFANHAHFAGYLELLLPMPIALVVARSVPRETRALYGFTAVLMSIAIIASRSRGGMVSLVAEIMFIVALGTLLPQSEPNGQGRSKEARLKRALPVAAIVVVIVAGVFWIGADPIIKSMTIEDEMKGSAQLINRGSIWLSTWALVREHPLAGVGLGASQTAYPAYRQDNGLGGIFSQAHNDYLQVLAECGIVGGVLALWFIVSILRLIFRGIRSRDPLLAGLALGSGAGIFGLLVHSLFDFNLQLPSHSLLFLLLSAVVSHLGAVAAQPEVEDAAEPELYGAVQVSAAGYAKGASS